MTNLNACSNKVNALKFESWIDWAEGDILIVALPRDCHPSSGRSASESDFVIVVLGAGEILRGNLTESLNERAIPLTTGETQFYGMRVLLNNIARKQGNTPHNSAGVLSILLWTESKVLVVRVDHALNKKARVIWADVRNNFNYIFGEQFLIFII